jgi:glucokinase
MRPIRVGVDLGGTKILGVAIEPDRTEAEVLASVRTSTPVGGDDIVRAIAEVAAHLGSELERPLGSVGVGAAGLVDERGMLRFGPNLPGVVDLDLIASIGSKVEVPVSVDNDATCAAVAEVHMGAARGADTALVVSLGTGIGGAIVMDGQIRRGAHHMAGEFGHIPVDPDGPECGCGNRGCWEQYASGSALGRLGRVAAEAGTAPGLLDRAEGRVELIGGFLVASAAADGDPAGRRVLDEFARWVAFGLAGLVNSIDPEVVVIGGGLVREGDLVLDPVREHLAPLVMGAAHRPRVPVVPATAGDSAAAIGAALIGEQAT